MTIKVGVVGYGTIGKRVADAVALQEDMELIGITAHSYNYRINAANQRGIKIFELNGDPNQRPNLKENGIEPAGTFGDFLKQVDIVVDCAPKKIGEHNIEHYYKPNNVKAIVQGGEKHDAVDVSFVAQCNYSEAVGKDYIRVVSCNTTGLCRTLLPVDKKYGILNVHATMVRRAADPWDIYHGPINAIVPVLELPSHHGPDVQTILPNIEIFTTAMSVPTTRMHVHSVTVDLKEEAHVDDVIALFYDTPRVRVVKNSERVRSTAEIMEFARDLGRSRGDMPEICIWEEAVGVVKNKLFYLQAVHQESDVVLENIDAIRAAMGESDAEKSMSMTNKTLGIEH